MGAGALRWRCARCDVSVGRLDGEVTPFPPTWSESHGSAFCLICSRAMAGDAAMDTAPAASSREDRVRLRRDAVIEFELGRVPEAPNRAIASSCRTSASAVKTVRDALEHTERAAVPAVHDGG
jgi:hypothetical protein